MSEFILQAYSRKELAQMYFPNHGSKNAYMNFYKWLKEEAHKDAAFFESIKGRKLLRKNEVEKIVSILGPP